MASLTATFEAERERAAARVRKAVEPYATFVHNEKHRLEDARESLAALRARLEDLWSRTSG